MDISVPPQLSALLRDEIRQATGYIWAPVVAIDISLLHGLPDYLAEAHIELVRLADALQIRALLGNDKPSATEDLAQFARALGRASFGSARSRPDLIRRARDFWGVVVMVMMRRVLFGRAGEAPWFDRPPGLAFAVDLRLSESTVGTNVYAGRVTPQGDDLLSAIAADVQPLVDAAHARLAPPQSLAALSLAAQERNNALLQQLIEIQNRPPAPPPKEVTESAPPTEPSRSALAKFMQKLVDDLGHDCYRLIRKYNHTRQHAINAILTDGRYQDKSLIALFRALIALRREKGAPDITEAAVPHDIRDAVRKELLKILREAK